MKFFLLFFYGIACSISSEAQIQLWGMTPQGGQHDAGVIFKTDTSGNNLTIQHNLFKFEGSQPQSTNLIQASNGMLYGMTYSGGTNSLGVIFQYDPSTSTYTKKHDFSSMSGSNPYGSLLQASNGMLYGMTGDGGLNGYGVIFQYNLSTSTYTKIFDFNGAVTGGFSRKGSLIQAFDGMLYGMTFSGGAYNYGTLFQFNPSTYTFTKKFDFDVVVGGNPHGSLMQANDSMLYGMTGQGGLNDCGVLFQYNLSTSTYTKKFDFDGTINGKYPQGLLIQASDGMLYGLTFKGGANDYGVLFQYSPSSSVCVKKFDFDGTVNGNNPLGSLVQASDGMLYGLTELGGINGYGVLFQYNPSSSVCIKKFDFDNSIKGSNPRGSLLQASDGMLYGMAFEGGINNDGVLFQYNPITSTYTKKFNFNWGINGTRSLGPLMQASDGMLYGMTINGGINNYGVIFQYDPLTSIYSKIFDFDGTVSGGYPRGSLIQASDGMLYGLAQLGGVNNDGVLFQYDPVTFTYMKKFDFDSINGQNPIGTLMQASDGMLYGTTYSGGIDNYGVLFQFNPSNSIFSKKFDFDGNNNGSHPHEALVQASDGMLYGTAEHGGANNYGVLFQYNISTSVYNKKYDFSWGVNGRNPTGSLTETSDGMLYGLAPGGGIYDLGVLFQYNPYTSTYTKKFDFNYFNGILPYGSLIQASDEMLYGITFKGGANNSGTLFKYNLSNSSLAPKFNFNQNSGHFPISNLIKVNKQNTDIVENSFLSNVSNLFPNPTTGRITIMLKRSLKNASVKLISMAGQTIAVEMNFSGNNLTFDISAQAKSMYFLEINELESVSRIKLIKN